MRRETKIFPFRPELPPGSAQEISNSCYSLSERHLTSLPAENIAEVLLRQVLGQTSNTSCSGSPLLSIEWTVPNVLSLPKLLKSFLLHLRIQGFERWRSPAFVALHQRLSNGYGGKGMGRQPDVRYLSRVAACPHSGSISAPPGGHLSPVYSEPAQVSARTCPSKREERMIRTIRTHGLAIVITSSGKAQP